MCQVCCRHRRSWLSNPLCRQFYWWAHCWEILFLFRNYLDCLCILCVVFICFWYHKSFHSILVFSSPAALFICTKSWSCLFSDGFEKKSFISSHFHYFFYWLLFSPWYSHYSCNVPDFMLLQVFFLGLLSMFSIHIHTEGWTICRLSECWFWCKLWYFCWWRWTSSWRMFL